MASYYEKLEDRHWKWEKESPCPTARCPYRHSGNCPGPCAAYNEWLHNEPIITAIRTAEGDVKRAQDEVERAKGRLIVLKEMRERILKS